MPKLSLLFVLLTSIVHLCSLCCCTQFPVETSPRVCTAGSVMKPLRCHKSVWLVQPEQPAENSQSIYTLNWQKNAVTFSPCSGFSRNSVLLSGNNSPCCHKLISDISDHEVASSPMSIILLWAISSCNQKQHLLDKWKWKPSQQCDSWPLFFAFQPQPQMRVPGNFLLRSQKHKYQ